MKKVLKRGSIVILGVCALIVLFYGLGTFQDHWGKEYYADKIYERDGSTYLDVTFKTEDDKFLDAEKMDMVAFSNLIREKENWHPKMGVSTEFYNDLPTILEYQKLVSANDKVKDLVGGNASEEYVLEIEKNAKYDALVRAEKRYGKNICSVPANLTIVLTTVR